MHANDFYYYYYYTSYYYDHILEWYEKDKGKNRYIRFELS